MKRKKELFTKEQHARFDAELADKRALARERRERKEARDAAATAKADGPMSVAERVRRHRLRSHDAAPNGLPAVRHPRVRAACARDLVRFGTTYFASFLAHPPSQGIIDGLIKPLERMILGGGQEVILFPRSAGKSTWTKIAICWALLYGHKRFVVVIAATADLADLMHAEVIGALADGGMTALAADFPAVAIPIQACEANPKKCRGVNVGGVNCGMEWKGHRFVFPTVYDSEGKTVEPSAGAVLIASSVGGSVKGAVRKADRPDFVILDDPQNRKMAESRSLTDKAEAFIAGDVMGLCGQTAAYSAVMTITPIITGDLAARYTDANRHGEWHVSRAQYCLAWSAEAEAALPGFCSAYRDDAATGAFDWATSTAYYREHRDAFAEVKVLDPLNFAPNEVDAVHHLLVMRARMTDEAFLAEYQLDVSAETGEFALDEAAVRTNVTGYAPRVLPPGTLQCVAYCDVNTASGAGLRWGVLACGPHRVTSMVAYGTYPADGKALVPPGTEPTVKRDLIIRAMCAVTHDILNLNLRLASGAAVRPLALCFDGGYEQRTVNETVKWIGENVKMHGVEVMWSIGRNWELFEKKNTGEESMFRKDHVRSSAVTDKKTGDVKKFLVIQTDYWREIAQKSFLKKYPESGCCSLFGTDGHLHAVFANEVTYERLVRTYVDEKTRRPAWEWYNARRGHNHYGDVLTGCFALARWKDIYSAAPRNLLAPVMIGERPPETAPQPTADMAKIVADRKRRVPVKKKPLFKPLRRK